MQFQLSPYKNSEIMLIKGWDELMNQAEENVGELNSMKLSQYYKNFENQITT